MTRRPLARLCISAPLFLLLTMIVACGGNNSNSNSTPPPQQNPPTNLSYQSPQVLNTGVPVNLTPTVTGTVTGYSVNPALPAGLSLDATSGTIAGTPTTGTASATYTIMASNSAGSTTFPLVLEVVEGPVGEVKDSGTTSPVVQVSSLAPASGQTVTVTASLAGAQSITLTPTGSGCGAITTMSGADSVQETAAVGMTGRCVLQADILTSAGTQTSTTEFMVSPNSLPPAAGGLAFVGGVYVPSGEVSFFPPSQTLTIVNANAPQHFINGGTGSIFITPSDPNNVLKAVVSFAGIPGYFIAPTTVVDGQVRIDLTIAQNFMTQMQQSRIGHMQMQPRPVMPRTPQSGSPSGKTRQRDFQLVPTGNLDSMLQLMGLDGTVSPPFPLQLTFQTVGSGPIQVSLTWSQPVDLDLHVVPPSGEEIYYGHRCDATGGCLDLDSNPACFIDNVDNENIVWPNSATPTPGQYTVRVDYYASCNIQTPIPYTVRVTNCGNSSTFTGSALGEDFGGEGSGTTITSFMYTPCSGFSVSGMAMYDDYPPTLQGLSPSPVQLPIRYAKVEVHQMSDDSILQTGNTDATGAYSMTFSMSSPGMYYVKVLSSSLPSGSSFMETVMNNQGVVYSAKSNPVDASMTPDATNISIHSTYQQSDPSGGAFNIFDVGANASNFVLETYGVTLPMLKWQWTPGVRTCTDGTASCFDEGSDTIYVLAGADDSDQYDDSVLAHEFGHFHAKYLTRPPTGDGDHGSAMQVPPNLAWSEGLATFFGQTVLHSPIYIDTTRTGVSKRNVETPESDVPVGTSDGTLSGNVSEAIVRAVLWDLADNAQDSRVVSPTLTVKDVINNQQAVFSDLSSLKSTTHDRGGSSVDLVDFLDQWLCSGYSMWDPMAGDNFNGLVTTLNQFPFSPENPANCH